LKIITGIELDFVTKPVQNNILGKCRFTANEKSAIDSEIPKTTSQESYCRK
jgi:hypothetical protein